MSNLKEPKVIFSATSYWLFLKLMLLPFANGKLSSNLSEDFFYEKGYKKHCPDLKAIEPGR